MSNIAGLKFLGTIGIGEDGANIYESPGGLFSANQFFWQNIKGGKAYGPFVSLPATIFDYESFLAKKKVININQEIKSNVIYVDFRAKKRINL